MRNTRMRFYVILYFVKNQEWVLSNVFLLTIFVFGVYCAVQNYGVLLC